jgi:hypothetical protein
VSAVNRAETNDGHQRDEQGERDPQALSRLHDSLTSPRRGCLPLS